MEVFYYRRLDVYQRAKNLANRVYDITESFPSKETYALCDQLQRASVSVMSNIAEGMGRNSNKDRIRFLDIANGSLIEVSSQLEIANMRHYIDDDCSKQFDEEILVIVKQIAKLRSKLETPPPPPNTHHPTPNT